MSKNFLIRANALLGALSLLLAGCHVQKKVTPAEPQEPDSQPVQEVREPEPEVKPLYGVPVPDEPIMCKYGAPAPRKYEAPAPRPK